MKRLLLVFVIALLGFSILIPKNVFPDPDAFYHAKMSRLFWESGPVKSFPWLDMTTLARNFDDQHLLLHVIEAPFVAWLGWATGARVTAVLLAAVFFAAAYACLRALNIRHAGVWTLLLGLTSPLLIRLMLGKATPLALTFFVLGLTAAWKRCPWLTALCTLLFALSHGGWIYLVGSTFLLALGQGLFDVVVEDRKFFQALRDSGWREVIASVGGAVIGIALHPNAWQYVQFLWIQVVKIGLETPHGRVLLGQEWLPADVGPTYAAFWPWFAALLLGGLGLFVSVIPVQTGIQDGVALSDKRRGDAARACIAFALPVAVLLALTLKSSRNAEYLAPALALWIPWIWQHVDEKRLLNSFLSGALFKPWWRYGMAALLIVALLKAPYDAFTALRDERYADNVYRLVMVPVSVAAKPGDRVFHSDWDDFPMLFNLDDRLRYVSGMDPTFLYEASSTLSGAYSELTWGRATSTPEQAWDLISERLNSRFVFIDKIDHKRLFDVIRADSRYHLLAETDDAATFVVQ